VLCSEVTQVFDIFRDFVFCQKHNFRTVHLLP